MALPVLRQSLQERKLGSTTVCLGSRNAHIISALALVLLCGCDPTKRIGDGQRLLKQNRVVVTEKSADPADLEAIIKQKPNKRILGVPFYLGLYNLRDPEKVMLKRMKKDSLCAVRNIERVRLEKKEKICDRMTRERNGEPPVVLDTMLTRRSSQQIRLYMQKEGWFDAIVSDTVHYDHRKWFSEKRGRPYRQPKAEVTYTVIPGPIYRLRNIRFTVDDPSIHAYVQGSWSESLLKTGDRFDADILDDERTRVTAQLKELGYLFFNRELVQYDADTMVGEHQVDLVMRMERPYSKTARGLKGTTEGTVFTIDQVTILTDRASTLGQPDTTIHHGYRILHKGQLRYNPKALLSSVFLLPDERFQQSNNDNTYRRLTGLRVFDRVTISYDTTGTGKAGKANAFIGLLPGKEQNLSLEGYGTNRGGYFGTTLSLGYGHRNLFRTLGYLQAKLNLGLEAQQSFTRTSSGQVNQSLLGQNALFNTISIGPEITVGFPRPMARLFSKSSGSMMLINALYNFQRRPDFTRTLARGSFGFEWNETPTKRVGFYLADLNVIKIPSKSAEFQQFLIATNDPVYTNSYTDHLIISIPRVTYTFSNQAEKSRRNSYYFRSTGELAGTLIRLLQQNAEQFTDTTTGRNYQTLFGVRYAEYLKLDNDFRINHVIHDKSSMAFRFAAGIGVPLKNLEVLPFESSFFGGGANGMRAWRARSLGPGAYSAPLFAFDRLGEIRIEANFEYRFKLIGFLEGALFTDVGNIWNRRADPKRPGAEFEFHDFMSELAVGTGAGARFNFDFFIVRFDLGMQTKDPALPHGERWLFQPKDEYEATLSEINGTPTSYRTQFNFNLGIGYPF